MCMVVNVMSLGDVSGDGFQRFHPIFDAPTSNSDWPNRYFSSASHGKAGPPFLSVSLR